MSDLIKLLDGGDEPRIGIYTIPVFKTSNEIKPHHLARGGDGIEENISPFTFTPQRIRLDKDDESFEDGDVHRHLYLQDLAATLAEDFQAPKVSEFKCHIAGCRQLFDTLEGYEHHYNSLHRHVCSSCKRSFPSNHLLDIHILEWHDALFQVMAEKQCMYQCLVEGCGLKFRTSKERKDHLIKTHSYPSDFRFDKSKNKRIKEKTPQQKDVCMVDPSSVLSGELENSNSMDISLPQMSENKELVLPKQQKPHYSYKVPSSVCFGQGSVRGFRGGRRKK
ncbi:zinc finger protein 511 isoform X2 [Electrophorus electricus]|uniref:zinc finger protein 511 isoform X2 n=1 Tax=Electrophorus electricus TaxID=8005 RepID=UPI000F0A63A3|nr:zinc finger protein 511 isoform X2 [Electrophorus electricus]